MKVRKFKSQAFAGIVEVQESAYNSIVADCRKSLEYETGSILVGSYSNCGTTAEILEAFSPPQDTIGTKSALLRGAFGLSEKLNSRWANTGTHYVGEWHYHPLGDGTPSGRDNSQMIQFARDSDMQCQVPVLLIVFPLDRDVFELRVFVFTQEGTRYSLDFDSKMTAAN